MQYEDASQVGLCYATGIDHSTLAEMMRRLHGKGLVSRKRNNADARAYSVRLTESGRTMLKKAIPMGERVDARLLDALPAGRRDAFMRDLERLVSLQDQPPS